MGFEVSFAQSLMTKESTMSENLSENPWPKKDFECGEKVRIQFTNSKDLDGQVVEVLGKSHEHIVDTYIVMLERPVPMRGTLSRKDFLHKAICLTEGCLERIK